MTIASRLKTTALLYGGMVLVISLSFGLAFEAQRDAFERSMIAEGLLQGSFDLNSLSNRYVRYPEERPKEQWLLAQEALAEPLSREALTAGDRRAYVVRMLLNLNDMKALFTALVAVDEERAAVQTRGGGDALLERRRAQLADLIVKRSREVALDASRLSFLSNEEIARLNRCIVTFIPIVAVLLSTVTLWTSARIGRKITGPVERLRAGAEQIGAGNLSYRIGRVSDDELGRLAAAFNRMAGNLEALTVSRDELVREMAERKRMEEVLRTKEAELREAQRIAHIGSWHWNATTDVTTGSDELLRIYGLDPATQSMPDFREQRGRCYPVEDWERLNAAVQKTLQTGVGYELDVRAFRNGELIWLTTRSEVVRDTDGTIVGLRGTVQDITERKRVEEDRERLIADLARSNQELEQFAYVASHDLQEPLRMVSSYMQLLEKRYKGQLDEKADTYIHFAVDGAQRMQKLIEGLLAYSRITRQGAEFRPVDTNKVFAQAVENLSAAIRESGAVVAEEAPLPTVAGDEMQLVQLFQNLIANAVKYRKPDLPPLVQVAARREGAEWVFSVHDNGIGIDPRYFERVFLLFQRLHTRQEYPGTGIGLSLCKRIVERHHGRLWVESTPGEGATFFFTLPADGEEGAKK